MAAVSVIIPVYNTGRYLDECLESLARQTLTDIEVLAIDDGSTDGSGERLDAFASKDARFRVFHQENRGQAAARNVGLENARGEYLMFCDSDDRYLPNMCERMIEAIRREPVDCIQCQNSWLVDDAVGPAEEKSRLAAFAYFNEERNVLLWNKIYRREVIQSFGIRFPAGHEADDDAFNFQYELVAKGFVHLKEPLYVYRIRNGSVMSNYLNRRPRNRADFLASATFVLDFALQRNLAASNAAFLRNMLARAYRTDKEFYEPAERPSHLAEYNALLQRIPGPRFRIVDAGARQFLLSVPVKTS